MSKMERTMVRTPRTAESTLQSIEEFSPRHITRLAWPGLAWPLSSGRHFSDDADVMVTGSTARSIESRERRHCEGKNSKKFQSEEKRAVKSAIKIS